MSDKIVEVYPSKPNTIFQQTAYTICIHGKSQMTSPTIHIQGVEYDVIEGIKIILEDNFTRMSKEIDHLLQSKGII
jgi:hypothetical protein